MLLELRFSICTLGLGAGTFLAALYGMNLKNFIEESDIGFWGVSGISVLASVIVLVYGLGRLRRVQRVSMWGESGPERGLGIAQRGSIKDAIAARKEEAATAKTWSWGLGRGTAAAGLSAGATVTEGRGERIIRKVQAWSESEKRGHSQQHWQHHRRRKLASSDSEGSPSPGSGSMGNTTSGLGTGKPTGLD